MLGRSGLANQGFARQPKPNLEQQLSRLRLPAYSLLG